MSIYCIILLFLICLRLHESELRTNNSKEYNENDEIAQLKLLQPLLNSYNIMFWRPQKVGSSTVLSILVSYAYRYNILPRRKSFPNSFCKKIAMCAFNMPSSKSLMKDSLSLYINGTRKENRNYRLQLRHNRLNVMAEAITYKISLTHDICNLPSEVIQTALHCAFQTNYGNTKEIMLLRDPLERALSVYYFWGELFRFQALQKVSAKNVIPSNDNNNSLHSPHKKIKRRNRIGIVNDITDEQNNSSGGSRSSSSIDPTRVVPKIFYGSFKYHGDETTPPPDKLANEFAMNLPYRAGMPGPSYTWSAIANSPKNALETILSKRILVMVTERLEESLIVLSHFLNWTLADVIYTKPRKALSKHPKSKDWPTTAISTIQNKLEIMGEYDMYHAANIELDKRIFELKKNGIDFELELNLFKELRKAVSKICFSEEYLERYRLYLNSNGWRQHPSGSTNRLRDTDDIFAEKGHSFSINREILYSYDVCGHCEAHSLLLSYQLGLSNSVSNGTLLINLPRRYRLDSVHFTKCPQ